VYQRQYRERVANGTTRPAPLVTQLPTEAAGPVEQAVEAELAGLPATQSRPAMSAVALAMSRILDGKVPTPKPGAAKVLATVLDTLHKGSAQQRRGSLALVREMTEKGG
jgi:hypothetical protein